jgi:succinate dehydrogenase / fumarate reductase, cytochrome b subunit
MATATPGVAPKTIPLYRTTVAKKAIMAISGTALFGFLIAHLAGNLLLYAGPQKMNEYAASLRTIPALLWALRIGLIVAFIAHVASSVSLARQNLGARPKGYRRKKDVITSYAARTMYWSGPIVLFYLVYHLAHLTFHVSPGYEMELSNVYNNLVKGFQVWWISAIYIVGTLAVGLHLYHGAWAMFGSLGASHPKYDPLRRWFAVALALGLTIGNLSFPIAVMSGLVQPTAEQFYFPELES